MHEVIGSIPTVSTNKKPAKAGFLNKCVSGAVMASSKEYLDFVLDQLSGMDGVFYKAMMGEYILYCQGKIVGGVYDDRFLVKDTPAARSLMPDAPHETPYEGAKEMLLVDDVEDREFLRELLEAMYDELPAPKKRKR